MIQHQQSAIDYWNLAALQYPLNGYAATQIAWDRVSQVDLIWNAVQENGAGCYWDFVHCITMPRQSGGFVTLAQELRWNDLNVAVVQWNSTVFSEQHPLVDGLAYNDVLMRHEAGHDHFLDDHGITPEHYTGLMCHDLSGTNCTPQSAANFVERAAASVYWQAKPIPANSISLLSTNTTSVTIQFGGQANADNLVPTLSTSLSSWNVQPAIPTSSTTYTFTGLTPSTTYYFRMVSVKAGQPDGSSQWVTATTNAIGRVANFTLDANDGSTTTMTWSALAGADAYQLCISNAPNSSWFCVSAGDQTSVRASVPGTTSKSVWYFAVRGVDANGRTGPRSNRGVVSNFNETVSGTSYNSYQTSYKDSGGIKWVNGFNLHSYAVWLVFNNGNGANNKFANPSGNSRMFASAGSWNVPDNNGAFGPFILAVESPSSFFLPQDSIAQSTVCMVISAGCG